jgi:diguanylate cyclase (GGDEF)-like protein
MTSESPPDERSSIDRQLARVLPARLHGDDLRVRPRALLLLRFTLIGLIFTLLLFPYFGLYLGRPLTGLMNFVYACSLVLTPVVLRRTGSVNIAAHWALGSAAVVLVIQCWTLGGVASLPYPWLSVLPIGGTLLCGTRGGAIWCAITTASLAGVGISHAMGWIPGAPVLEGTQLVETATSTVALTLAIAALGWLSETRATQLVRRLERDRQTFLDRSLRDPLTGLANRALLMDSLLRSEERSRRSGQPAALFFLDLDGFKAINDQFGHATGDRTLKRVAKRIRDGLRASDIAARLGGDEFALIVEDIEDPKGVEALAEKIAKAVAEPMEVDGHEIRVGASIGVARYPLDLNAATEDADPSARRGTGPSSRKAATSRIESVLKSADAAMYEAKRAGVRFRVHEPATQKR